MKKIKQYKAGVGIKTIIYLIVITFFVSSCEDFVDVDLPKNLLTSETVFEDTSTTVSALRSIYSKMRDGGLTNANGLSKNLGFYTDELEIFNDNSYYEHDLSGGGLTSWWSHSFNIIYAANAIIEGVDNSTALSLEDREQFKGEALFIRGFIYTLLVEMYGPVPYIKTTDYIANSTVSRTPVDAVYSQIIDDLLEASNLLDDDISGERVRPYKAVAEALLARVYLYTQQWELAETMASLGINSFVLEPALSKVFLKNSSGSIWQFKPRLEGRNTADGFNFIFTNTPRTRPALTASLIDDLFEPFDLRAANWTKEVIIGSETWYHAYKYKQAGDTFEDQNEEVPTSLEYPVIFRLAEQYLIRAEARANRGDIPGAQSDLNVIKNRAGLPNTTAANREDLVNAILQERRVELFTELGHRWFDLKRTGKAAEVLASIKPNWQDRNILFPVPESEILLNPNLLPQNEGYN